MIKVGSKVLCRFYNTPERKFYGDYFNGIVLEIKLTKNKSYLVQRESLPDIWLHRKEIKKEIK